MPNTSKERQVIERNVSGSFDRDTPGEGIKWYTRYSDGWVEQGGSYLSIPNNNNVTIPLQIEMRDKLYTITIAQDKHSDYYPFYSNQIGSLSGGNTTKQVIFTNRRLTGNDTRVMSVYWRVEGFAKDTPPENNVNKIIKY